MRSHSSANDAGRVPVGTIVTLVVLVGAGLAAWWFVQQFSGDGEFVEETAGPAAGPTTSVPPWLAGAGQALPPEINDDERLPQARLMVDWLWDLVDDDWQITIVRDGAGDGSSSLTDIQVMYLQAPDETLFKLYELRTDYLIDVVHWDPQATLAWLIRGGRPGIDPVVEFDLRTADSVDEWDENAVSSANDIPFGLGNVLEIGQQPDGRELWGSYDESGFTTGVFWRREASDFQESLISSEIRRLRLQGYSQDAGVDAWVDPESMTAVYRATFREENSDAVRMERWLLHDLANDTYSQVEPRLPSGSDCRPIGRLDAPGQFDGDRIVAGCGNGTFLIDPTGDAAPEQV